MKNDRKEFSGIEILNPKLYSDSSSSLESKLYPYYAGYARSFAETVLQTIDVSPAGMIVDPWNGSGTTTLAATKLGYKSFGQDLNPVMVLVAKANLLSSQFTNLKEIASDILEAARSLGMDTAEDPLCTWVTPSTASVLRAIEVQLNQRLISSMQYTSLLHKSTLDEASSLVSFFYVALFRTVRQLLVDFVPSNPTWVKKPKTLRNRKRPEKQHIYEAFLSEVDKLSTRLMDVNDVESPDSRIVLGDSQKIDLADESVELIVTSPPYCTRIDYAVSTSIEFAVLGASMEQFDLIRRSLMGTSTVPKSVDEVGFELGYTCHSFLDRVYRHQSKASQTYYYKSHVQYFTALSNSIGEISRVLKVGGKAVVVVQDSYYKDVRNDVGMIVEEMAGIRGLELQLQRDFSSSRSMSGLHAHSKKYRATGQVTESVLCFVRK